MINENKSEDIKKMEANCLQEYCKRSLMLKVRLRNRFAKFFSHFGGGEE